MILGGLWAPVCLQVAQETLLCRTGLAAIRLPGGKEHVPPPLTMSSIKTYSPQAKCLKDKRAVDTLMSGLSEPGEKARPAGTDLGGLAKWKVLLRPFLMKS